MINNGSISCNLDFAVMADNEIGMVSFFDRSHSSVKSLAASMNTEQTVILGRRYPSCNLGVHAFIQPVIYGKEKFYHCLALNRRLNQDLFLTVGENKEADFYNFLMNVFDYPLLYEWRHEMYGYAVRNGLIRFQEHDRFLTGKHYMPREIPYNGENIDSENIMIYSCHLKEAHMEKMIKELFIRKNIFISRSGQKKMEFDTLDSYFNNYGTSIVTNLENQIKPLTQLSGNINTLVLNNMRLFPQQAAQANGITKLLDKSNYAFLNMGMGTGKTICSISMIEGYENVKYMRRNKGATLKDIYSSPNNVRYRNMVLCPSHLIDKWVNEIKKEIPYSRVTIINDLYQLICLWADGKERSGKDWYVVGKEFAKLSYQSVPAPTKEMTKRAVVRECGKCNTISLVTDGKEFQCDCGCTEYQARTTGHVVHGMLCPSCNNVLLPNAGVDFNKEIIFGLESKDFAVPNKSNQRCHVCGEEIWKPFVKNINTDLPGSLFYKHAKKNIPWRRATHYTNKAHKGKKTVWVHEDFQDEYFEEIGEMPLRIHESGNKGVRRYDPASYIKKTMKGYFDMLIVDEAHLFKGGSTAQGIALHALVKASKKQLLLTGTIAGGYANHLFYLLYRVDPARMLRHGFSYHDEMKFTKKYGTLESKYEIGEDESIRNYNKLSRGRQVQPPRPKPGISPLIFSDFLLDKTVFMDLSDMSRYLPKYHEIVETIDIPRTVERDEGLVKNPEYDVYLTYQEVIKKLKQASMDGDGKGVLSTMLQFSLSYMDKPYGVSDICSPTDGRIIARVPEHSRILENGGMLAKEKRLIKIIGKELSEQRNCVVYAEFTNSEETCVTGRLKEIIMKNCDLRDHEVVIIESLYPPAIKREQWMHQKAELGAKVFIVHPKCVETGLDFIWKNEAGITYNYPTLIFYQLGTSLFTVWQASRRAYRLNQTEECRTYYMAYRGTVQEAVIGLIAEKQMATSAIQGKFSTEGLAAMAHGTDVRLKLAQAMSDLDSINGSGLQDMFDVLADDTSENSTYADYIPMQTLAELLGEEVYQEVKERLQETDAAFADMTDVFVQDIFNNFMEQFNEDFFQQLDGFMDMQGFQEGTDIHLEESKEEKEFEFIESRRDRKYADMGMTNMFAYM